jgi:hypothetical protein
MGEVFRSGKRTELAMVLMFAVETLWKKVPPEAFQNFGRQFPLRLAAYQSGSLKPATLRQQNLLLDSRRSCRRCRWRWQQTASAERVAKQNAERC